MMKALGGFDGIIKLGERTITNLRFADDINLLAGSRGEFEEVTTRLNSTPKKYEVEISEDKSKVMVY